MYSKGLEIVRDVGNVGNMSEEVRSKVRDMTIRICSGTVLAVMIAVLNGNICCSSTALYLQSLLGDFVDCSSWCEL